MLNVTNTKKAFSLQQDETNCSRKHNSGGHHTPNWKVHGWSLLQRGFLLPKPPSFVFCYYLHEWMPESVRNTSHISMNQRFVFFTNILHRLPAYIIIFVRKRGAFCMLGSVFIHKCCHSLLWMKWMKIWKQPQQSGRINVMLVLSITNFTLILASNHGGFVCRCDWGSYCKWWWRALCLTSWLR